MKFSAKERCFSISEFPHSLSKSQFENSVLLRREIEASSGGHAVDHWTVEALRAGTPLGIQVLSGLCSKSLGQPWLHTEPHSQKIKREIQLLPWKMGERG